MVLYGGVMQKRWSVNSMMLTFIAFAVVLVIWVLYGYNMAFGKPIKLAGGDRSFFSTFIGHPSSVLSAHDLEKQGSIPLIGTVNFPQSTLVYFQLVFAAITPLLMLGLGARTRQLQGVDPLRPSLVVAASTRSTPS